MEVTHLNQTDPDPAQADANRAETPPGAGDGEKTEHRPPVKPPMKPRKRTRGPARHITVQQVLEAVKQAGGGIQDTARLLSMHLQDFYEKWRYQPEVDAAIKLAKRIGFERVTETVYEQALNGDRASQSLYLKYCPIGKQEGWTDTQTITLKAEKPLTEDERAALKGELFG